MWETNEVLRFDENLYRILRVKPGEIVWIKLDDPKALPEYILEFKLLSWLENERLSRSSDPYLPLHNEEPAFGSIAFDKREKNLKVIHPIIIDDKCFESKIRSQRVAAVESAGLASKVYIYRLAYSGEDEQ
ncbi:hypothetical protein [Serratia proteamaculans]|uniref:Uncharacterized protein n=1 Tax=Serratia proteamaculans TaxID=28151 RepID=A0A5Q2VB74_SERPR|nr:hypothetical protein [Serratia proteamaculans]QGH61339.1 hypothetical protein GHV41_11020 [Serratia proteamaculans]